MSWETTQYYPNNGMTEQAYHSHNKASIYKSYAISKEILK